MKKLITLFALILAFNAQAFETLTGGKISTTAAVVNSTGLIDATNPLAVTVVSGGGGGGSALPNATTNITQFGSAAVVTGAGVSGAGIPRVTIANDSFGGAFPVQNTAPIPTGTNTIGAISNTAFAVSNFPVTQPVSGAITVSNIVNVTGYRGIATDRSGTITTAGVSQTLSALNANRVHFEIQANLANTTPLCFNFTAAASATANTRCLIAGATYNMDVPNFVSTELITVWSATAGAAWSAKEY